VHRHYRQFACATDELAERLRTNPGLIDPDQYHRMPGFEGGGQAGERTLVESARIIDPGQMAQTIGATGDSDVGTAGLECVRHPFPQGPSLQHGQGLVLAEAGAGASGQDHPQVVQGVTKSE
jgi:hypothetical protein